MQVLVNDFSVGPGFSAPMMKQSPCQTEVSKLPTNLYCLRPTEMSGSWLSAPGGEVLLSKNNQTQAQTQMVALNLAPSPSLPGTNAGKFYPLYVDT